MNSLDEDEVGVLNNLVNICQNVMKELNTVKNYQHHFSRFI